MLINSKAKKRAKILRETIREKAKAKAKAKAKRKVKETMNDDVLYNNANQKYTNTYKPYANLEWTILLAFNAKVESKWKLPSNIKVSESVEYKFQKLSLFPQKLVKDAIEEELRIARYGFQFNISRMHKMSPLAKSIQDSYITKQQNEWKKVRIIYNKLFNFNIYNKKLVHMWRANKCINNIKNTNDIITMDPPKKPVYVIDFKQMCSYTYEARSIKRIIENRLFVSDYMFPNPQYPINPLSNQNFTSGQLLSIINQCNAYGEFSWILDRFKNSEFCLILFAKRFKQQLKLEAINQFFRQDTNAVVEMVLEFFSSEAEAADLPTHKLDKFVYFFNLKSKYSIFKDWIRLTKKRYIAMELQDPVELLKVNLQSDILIQNVYDLF